eukprot:scaffold99190_cov42-Attheya_sp.AAC.2
MPRSKNGIGSRHKRGTGNNRDMIRISPCDVRCYRQNQSHSKDKQSRSPVIAVPTLQDPAIHPQMSSTQSPTPSAPPPPNSSTMPVPHNGTTPTSQPIASFVASPRSNRESHNHYGGIVDVSRITPSRYTIIIQQYRALCNETEDPSTFVSTPPIPTIASLSQSTISSLGSSGSRSTLSSGTTSSSSSHSGTRSGTNSLLNRISGCDVSADTPVAPSTSVIDPPATSTTVIDPPSPQDLSNVFAASAIHSSIDRTSILAAGDTPEACSQSLSIALNHALVTPIVAITGAIVPRQFASALHQQAQKTKLIKCATSIGSKRKQTDDRQSFVNVSILSVLNSSNSPSKNKNKHEVHGVQQLLQCSRSTAYRRRKALSTKRAHLIAESTNTDVKWSVKPRAIRVKKVSKELRARLVQWILKNPDVRQSPITRDTLLIKDVETGVKRRVPKLLLECSMRQLHNELIATPDKGGLLGARHEETNDVIISDTMLRSLVPPELRPMTDSHKIMCGCTTCNTSKYLQTSLNAWRRKHMKHMEAQSNASRSRAKATLLEAYTNYAEFVFPDNEPRHPRCEDAADSVVCAPITEYNLPNWKCVLRRCSSCSTIAIPALELDISSTAPMIMFHT